MPARWCTPTASARSLALARPSVVRRWRWASAVFPLRPRRPAGVCTESLTVFSRPRAEPGLSLNTIASPQPRPPSASLTTVTAAAAMPCERHQGTQGVKCARCIQADRRARGSESLLTELARHPERANRVSHWYSREEIAAERQRLGLPRVSVNAPSRGARFVEQRPIEQRPTALFPIEQRPIEQLPIEQLPIEQLPIEQRPIEQLPADLDPRLLRRPKPKPTLRPAGSGVRAPARCRGGGHHSWGDGICQRCGFNSNAFAHQHRVVDAPAPQQRRQPRVKKQNRSPKKKHTSQRHVKGPQGAQGRALFKRGMSLDEDSSGSDSSDSSSD